RGFASLRREPNGEFRTSADLTLNREAAAMGADNSPAGGKSQAGAARFRRKERSEQPAQYVGTHAGAGVDQTQTYLTGLMHRLNGQFSTLRHRLGSVEHEVQKGLLEKVLVELNFRQVGGKVTLDINIGLPGRGAEEIDHFLNDRRQVAGCQLQIFHAGKA